MKEAAKNLNFEKAARLRDGLKALSVLQNQNIVEGFDGDDRDYIASWREGELVSFTVLKIRSGKLMGRDNYRTLSLNEEDELAEEFMASYYTEKSQIPPKIYTVNTKRAEIMERWLKETFKAETKLISVEEGIDGYKMHDAAINMARQNAKEDIIRRERERGDTPGMKELQEVLGLEKLPVRIEGFDIAHIGGKFPVASLISFYNGNPDKKKLPLLPPENNRWPYRRFPVNERGNYKALFPTPERRKRTSRSSLNRRRFRTGKCS